MIAVIVFVFGNWADPVADLPYQRRLRELEMRLDERKLEATTQPMPRAWSCKPLP